jgi:hypothetical protein
MAAHLGRGRIFSEYGTGTVASRLQEAADLRLERGEGSLAALYAFGLESGGEGQLAALFSKDADQSVRLDLELSVGRALGIAALELLDLRRMPLVSRYRVINQGQPLYVGQPDVLAEFIEDTIARYAAFYPLLEALYWKVEMMREAQDADSPSSPLGDEA